MSEFTHLDDQGAARMVDVGGKPVSQRQARASGRIRMSAETLSRIRRQEMAKGDVLQVARLAGIMAAKQTPQLIPLCHPLPLASAEVDFAFPDASSIDIRASVSVVGSTGVEMEALTAVSIAALTIYDMCKSVDRGMMVESIRLDHKSGGASGTFERQEERS